MIAPRPDLRGPSVAHHVTLPVPEVLVSPPPVRDETAVFLSRVPVHSTPDRWTPGTSRSSPSTDQGASSPSRPPKTLEVRRSRPTGCYDLLDVCCWFEMVPVERREEYVI